MNGPDSVKTIDVLKSDQPPSSAQVPETSTEEETTTEFFPVSEGKLLTLYLLSFGFYGIFWFYKNWMLQKKFMDKNIYPMWRAIFSIFFTHALFNRINRRAQQVEKEHTFNANILATLFVATIIASNILDRSTLNSNLLENVSNSSLIITSLVLFFISAYPLVKVQATVNRINNDMLGYLNHKYSMWNYVLIVLCVLSWLLLGFGLLAELMGLAEAV